MRPAASFHAATAPEDLVLPAAAGLDVRKGHGTSFAVDSEAQGNGERLGPDSALVLESRMRDQTDGYISSYCWPEPVEVRMQGLGQ